MSHSGIDWQAEACLYWHAFVFLLSFTPLSLIPPLFACSSKPFSISSSPPFAALDPYKHIKALQLTPRGCTFSLLQLESLFIYNKDCGCASSSPPFAAKSFSPWEDVVDVETMWGVPQCVEPSQRALHHCHTWNQTPYIIQSSSPWTANMQKTQNMLQTF